jgi:tetratricopeptide (TPR) repeat protein
MIPRTRLTALALILLLCRTVGADSVSERLDRGASEFAYKNFENAAGIIEKLLYPTLQLTAEEDIVKAREMLGLCYFYLGQEDKARKEFTALLYLRPGHRLDPFLIPPPAVAFFDRIRNDPRMKARLEKIEKERLAAIEKKNKKPPRTLVRRIYLERDRVRHNRLIAFLPFGLGQFQNGDSVKGILLATGGGLSLAANIVCYSLLVALANENGNYASEDLDLARGLRIGQYVSLGIFAASWIYGAIDANIYFQPLTEAPYRKAREEEQVMENNTSSLLPVGVPGGAGFSFQGRF